MSLSHKKELQQYFQCVTKKRRKTTEERKISGGGNKKKRKKQSLRGIIKFQYYLHQRIS